MGCDMKLIIEFVNGQKLVYKNYNIGDEILVKESLEEKNVKRVIVEKGE